MFPFSLVDSVAMFFIYAFVGWVVEVAYHAITVGKFVNRGFLNGPLCPVYGFGFYGVIIALLPVQDNFPLLFFGSLIITSAIEFIAGFILYKAFELRWWDYRDNKFNIMGFVCLKFSIYWGVACSLAMKTLYPSVNYVLGIIPEVAKIVVVVILTIALIVDFIDTTIATIGMKKKLRVIGDISTEIRNVSDRIGGKIYDGVETVVTKTAPTIENYEEYKKLHLAHREEERQLLKKHQEEEKALLDRILKEEKQSLIASRDAANDKLKENIKSIKKREKRIIRRLSHSQTEVYNKLIEMITSDKGE